MNLLHQLIHRVSQNHRVALQTTLWTLGVLVTVVIAFFIANPPPPKTLSMATGPETGAYSQLGQRYRDFFAKRGIDLQLVATKGAQENAHLIQDRQNPISIAFMQSGLIAPEQSQGIETLGSIAYEPIWIFYRGKDIDGSLERFTDFSQRKIAIGEPGSGTYTEAMHMLSLNGLDTRSNLITIPTSEAVTAINEGKIDAIYLIQGLHATNIQRLVANPELNLLNFVRAEAYAQQIPYLERLVIPMGGLDLKRNFPAENTQLIATTTELVIKDNLHPAIQMLLMQAAREINGKESAFTKRGEFPAFRGSGLPESEQATLYYQKGLPFLMNHLPFWLAEFIHRSFFFLLPILVLAYPLVRFIPFLWEKRMRERFSVVYAEVEALEKELTTAYDPASLPAYLARLDAIEQAALKVRYSKALARDYYTLRSHIQFVRERLIEGKPYQKFSASTQR